MMRRSGNPPTRMLLVGLCLALAIAACADNGPTIDANTDNPDVGSGQTDSSAQDQDRSDNDGDNAVEPDQNGDDTNQTPEPDPQNDHGSDSQAEEIDCATDATEAEADDEADDAEIAEEELMDQAPPDLCPPSAEDVTDDLSIDEAILTQDDGADTFSAALTVTNHTDLSLRFIDPTSVAPRVDDVDGVRRLTYLRINFTHDDDHISNAQVDTNDPGAPETLSVAAGDSLQVEAMPVRGFPDQLDTPMQLCLEVVPTVHPDSPAANHETGHSSNLHAGFAPGDTAVLACTEDVDVRVD